jgi:aminoglycoside phosphotransferase family enzyme/predicted kinase
MSDALPPLIQSLLSPSRYPHPVDAVALLETHGAWVLLAGDWAYKIKKPVHFPFMDFSTLTRRHAACETELRVNRRFSRQDPTTQLYHNVLSLLGSAQEPRWGSPGEDGEAIEFAVQMCRFDAAGQLDRLCARGALTANHLEDLAQDLGAFQASALVAPADSPWGEPAGVIEFARDNFDVLREHLTQAEDTQALHTLARWSETRFAEIEPLLAERRRSGCVREGHGDLHLANLVLIGEVVLPFDAIEFNDALRWIDTASDIAFLWMDLLHQRQPGLANRFLSAWLDTSGDTTAPEVLPFFATYRALVRAKVAVIRSAQPGADVAAAQAEARAYLALALTIAEPPAPQLVITHGLSGSGKTWASGRWLLAETSGRTLRLRSDVERKRLQGLSALAASGSGLNTGLYAPRAHGDTYASLLSRAARLLSQGWSVLVDAAFLRQHERQAFADLAADQTAAFHILAPEAPVAVLRERIEARQARGNDASEATLAVLEQQLGWLEPLSDTERSQRLPTPS